jgi:hypothetical protein
MNVFIQEIIKIKITELIESIQSNIPNLMTKENSKKEIDHVINCIKYKKMQNTRQKCKIDTKKKNKIKIKKNNAEIPDNLRCSGRVWGPVKKIKEEIIYGSRCKNKKINNSNYCFLHHKKLTHGDFLKEPDKFIKEHFINERPKKE